MCVVVHYLVRQLVIVPWVSVNVVCASVWVCMCVYGAGVCMVRVCAWCVCVYQYVYNRGTPAHHMHRE